MIANAAFALSLAVAVFLLARALLVEGQHQSSAWHDALLGRERKADTDERSAPRRRVGLRSRSLIERIARVSPRLSGPVDRLVTTAGLSDRFSGSWVIGMSAISGLGMLLFYTLASAGEGLTQTELALAPLVTVLGGAVPWVVISGRAKRRQDAIERALPDLLDLLTVSIEAGLALEAALARVTERGRGPLSDEVRRTMAEIGLGRRRRDALQGLAFRTNVPQVAQLVNAMNQADRSGMQLGPVLRSQAEQIRQRRRQRAEEKAMQAPLKMLFPLMFFIFPAMFLVIMGPAAINVMETMG